MIEIGSCGLPSSITSVTWAPTLVVRAYRLFSFHALNRYAAVVRTGTNLTAASADLPACKHLVHSEPETVFLLLMHGTGGEVQKLDSHHIKCHDALQVQQGTQTGCFLSM